MEEKSESREKISNDEVGKRTWSKQYQPFRQRRIELRKAKNEKWLDKINEAREIECRNRLIKERLCAKISQYGGLWLKEEQIDAKLAEMRTDSEKLAALSSVSYNSGKK